MMRSLRLVAALATAILPPLLSDRARGQEATDFLVRASRRAVVRSGPSTSATDIERLDPGDERACVLGGDGLPEQRQGFYRIVAASSGLGWVSRFTVRLDRGAPHVAEPSPEAADSAGGEDASSRHTEAHLAAFRAEHAGRFGLPIGQTVLVNEGYVVGYDPRLKIPAWVQYRLTADDFGGDRTESFREDERLPEHQRSTLADYETQPVRQLWALLGMTRGAAGTDNFFARGHMVPDQSQSRSTLLQSDTYLLSNMSPQVQDGFNGGTWLSLERHIREWVTAERSVTVIAGPIFDSAPRQLTPARTREARVAALDDPEEPKVRAQPPTARQVIYNVLGDSEVAVPTAFFCVVLDDSQPTGPKVLAFIIDNASRTQGEGRTLASCLRSVREIQERTGLDLLAGLSSDLESHLENLLPSTLWQP